MRRLGICFATLLFVSSSTMATELEAMTESELAGVSGQEGVLINLSLRNNVGMDNTPIGCMAPSAVTSTSLATNACRLGLQFAGGANATKWLMLKEYYGTFRVKDLRLDGTTLPATNTGFYNADRFDSNDGIAGCGSTPLLPGCNPKGLSAVKFSYPGTDAPGTYDDFHSFLNIGRVWLESDIAGSPATPGYKLDTSLKSFLGVRMSDSRMINAPAQTRFVGTGYVYGF